MPPPARRFATTPSSADQDAYQRASSLAGKGVAVVSAVSGRWDYAVPITDFLSVSYDPPTLLVSLYGLSRMADAVADAGRFALSLLAADQQQVADWLSDPGAPVVGLLGQVPHSRLDEDGPALISGALTWFDARVVAEHEAATHRLFVGEVAAVGAHARWDAAPLLRFAGRYRH